MYDCPLAFQNGSHANAVHITLRHDGCRDEAIPGIQEPSVQAEQIPVFPAQNVYDLLRSLIEEVLAGSLSHQGFAKMFTNPLLVLKDYRRWMHFNP